MKRIYILLFLAVLISAYCKAQTTILATDPHIRYEGRIWMDKANPILSWSGSSVKIRFEGNNISFNMREEGDDYYTEILDGHVIGVVHPTADSSFSYMVAGLTSGPHTLELFKRTEWAMGKTWFYGFKIANGGKVLSLPPLSKRKIEFYGNSITCGYAALDSTGQDRGTPPFEDGYNSYAAITARHYNAQFSNISKSGIGITISWFPLTAPEMYDKGDANDPNTKWDFSKYTPDVVVINLFQNDSWLVTMPTNEQFKARFGTTPPTPEFIINAYANFVKSIREKYPKAQIICILGSMDATKPGSPWPGYIRSAVLRLHDSRIFVHPIPYKGSYGHPSLKEQQAMADDLIGFMDKNVKW